MYVCVLCDVPPIPRDVYSMRKYAVTSKKMMKAMKKNPALSEEFVNSHLCVILFSTVKK